MSLIYKVSDSVSVKKKKKKMVGRWCDSLLYFCHQCFCGFIMTVKVFFFFYFYILFYIIWFFFFYFSFCSPTCTKTSGRKKDPSSPPHSPLPFLTFTHHRVEWNLLRLTSWSPQQASSDKNVSCVKLLTHSTCCCPPSACTADSRRLCHLPHPCLHACRNLDCFCRLASLYRLGR